MNYLDILTTLEDYYANLLIVQYHGKSKAVSTIKLFVDLLFVNIIFFQIRDAFDWKTAIGNQLDIIGKWVGVDRFFLGQTYDFSKWFSLLDWDVEPVNSQVGLSDYAYLKEYEAGFVDYAVVQASFNRLPDEQYRILIGLKIIKNSIDHTAKSIDDAIWDYFGGKVYTFWNLEERCLYYYYSSDLNKVMHVAYEKKVLPCPSTVKIQLQEIIENG